QTTAKEFPTSNVRNMRSRGRYEIRKTGCSFWSHGCVDTGLSGMSLDFCRRQTATTLRQRTGLACNPPSSNCTHYAAVDKTNPVAYDSADWNDFLPPSPSLEWQRVCLENCLLLMKKPSWPRGKRVGETH
ncbi:MAG: hypothetical protein ABIO29_05455, partial [Sphingomicrobium sp.]